MLLLEASEGDVILYLPALLWRSFRSRESNGKLSSTNKRTHQQGRHKDPTLPMITPHHILDLWPSPFTQHLLLRQALSTTSSSLATADPNSVITKCWRLRQLRQLHRPLPAESSDEPSSLRPTYQRIRTRREQEIIHGDLIVTNSEYDALFFYLSCSIYIFWVSGRCFDWVYRSTR